MLVQSNFCDRFCVLIIRCESTALTEWRSSVRSSMIGAGALACLWYSCARLWIRRSMGNTEIVLTTTVDCNWAASVWNQWGGEHREPWYHTASSAGCQPLLQFKLRVGGWWLSPVALAELWRWGKGLVGHYRWLLSDVKRPHTNLILQLAGRHEKDSALALLSWSADCIF